MGGKWDPAAKKWYVPTGVSTTPFQSWMQSPRGAVPSPHSMTGSRSPKSNTKRGRSSSQPHERTRSVLYKYRRQLLDDEEEEEDELGIDDNLEDDDGEGDGDVEGEDDDDSGEGKGLDEEDDSEDDDNEDGEDRDDGRLLCVECSRRLHRDSFSDRQRRHGTDLDRYCLKHTGGSVISSSTVVHW